MNTLQKLRRRLGEVEESILELKDTKKLITKEINKELLKQGRPMSQLGIILSSLRTKLGSSQRSMARTLGFDASYLFGAEKLEVFNGEYQQRPHKKLCEAVLKEYSEHLNESEVSILKSMACGELK